MIAILQKRHEEIEFRRDMKLLQEVRIEFTLLNDYPCNVCGISGEVERCGMCSDTVYCNACEFFYTYNTPQRVTISDEENVVKLI